MKAGTLYLVDGHALAYRTYFALTAAGGGDASRWITRQGEPTAGTYGFTSVLFKIIEQDRPDYLAVSFDTGRTFRDDLFPAYKGTRAKMPDDLGLQIGRIREVVQAFNLPILEAEGYEADDVLGTLAEKAGRLGLKTIILTGDRDLLQLADENTTIRLAGNKLSEAQDFGPREVLEKFGVGPEQFVDYKAIVGDKSDNIPGVAGVGEKTAVSLLQQHGSLDGIYQNLDAVPARFQKKLAEGRENAYLSQRLSRIVTDLDFDFDLQAAAVGEYDRRKVADLFRTLEFRSLLARLPQAGEAGEAQLSMFGQEDAARREKGGEGEKPVEMASGGGTVAPPGARTRAIVVNDENSLQEMVEALQQARTIAFDVETTSTNQMSCDLVGIALAVNEGEGYYLPVGHTGEGSETQLPLENVIEALRGPLTDPAIPKVGHNLKYDYIVLARSGLRASPLAYDTMLAEWLCEPASRNLGLKNLAFHRLGAEMSDITGLIGKGKKQITMSQVAVPLAAAYAAADVDMTLRLIPPLTSELQEKNCEPLLLELEIPLIPVLAQMEMNGIRLDTGHLSRMSVELEDQLKQIEQGIYAMVGGTFNLNSPVQLSRALFETMKLEPPDRTRKTSTGNYSTAAEILELMREQHLVVAQILEYRELSKLKSTYVDALPQQVNPATGRVHTQYNQTGSVTGRVASSEPNLQNIPIRTDLGRRVRKAFVAEPGWKLVAVDYSQVELRVMAHLARDRAMMAAFKAGQDIHTATASAVFNVPLDQVTREQRRDSKTINFGLIFGMSAFGLTRSSELTLAESENFVKAYFEKFPGVKNYLDRTKELARSQGYVETLLGRRRYFPVLQRPGTTREDAILRSRADREAINAPVQGTAADIIKRAMLAMPVALARQKLKARMLLQVHDELVFECPEAEVEDLARVAVQVMENAFKLKVPLVAEARAGTNWDEMVPIDHS